VRIRQNTEHHAATAAAAVAVAAAAAPETQGARALGRGPWPSGARLLLMNNKMTNNDSLGRRLLKTARRCLIGERSPGLIIETSLTFLGDRRTYMLRNQHPPLTSPA
jgi:hypothetical protein